MSQRNNDTPIRHTLKAYECLKRQKHIDTLFSQGKAYSVFPLTVKYLSGMNENGEPIALKAGFSVSKKKFKHAVKRNRAKRLMREAWRLNKYLVDNIPENRQLHLFFIYTHTVLLSYKEVETAMLKCIVKLKMISYE